MKFRDEIFHVFYYLKKIINILPTKSALQVHSLGLALQISMAAPKLTAESIPPRRPDLSLVEDISTEEENLVLLGREQTGNTQKITDGSRSKFLYSFYDADEHYDPVYEAWVYETSAKNKHTRGLGSSLPWMTGLHGHHESINEEAIANNMDAFAIGRERANVLRGLQQIGHISLQREARVQLLIHQDLAKRGLFMSQELVGTGYSLAAIVLNGVAAFAGDYSTKLVHGEALDPGPAGKIRPHELAPHSLVVDALRETMEISKILKNSPKEEKDRLVQTFPLSVHTALQNLDFFFALAATGESKKLATRVPKDTSLNITAFKNFRFNQIDRYRALFSNHPRVRINVENGSHFTGADKKWRMLMIGRIGLIQTQLDNNVALEDIDHAAIDARVRNAIQSKASLRNL
jgi:hypothetical protein